MTACIHGDVCREYLRQHMGIICQTCPSGCRFYEPKRELEQLKAKLVAVNRLADKYHDKASTILKSWREDPMGGTDLGRFYAFEQMVGEIWEVLG